MLSTVELQPAFENQFVVSVTYITLNSRFENYKHSARHRVCKISTHASYEAKMPDSAIYMEIL